jgi:hypothetical protein
MFYAKRRYEAILADFMSTAILGILLFGIRVCGIFYLK